MSSWCRQCEREQDKVWRAGRTWQQRLLKMSYDRHVKRWPDEVFDLTPGFLSGLNDRQGGRCFWYGVPLSYDVKSGPALVSLDRIHNDHGYTKTNVLLVCDAANRGRREHSSEEFEIFVEQLRAALRS